MHSNVTIKNVSWPHFSLPILYITAKINGHQLGRLVEHPKAALGH